MASCLYEHHFLAFSRTSFLSRIWFAYALVFFVAVWFESPFLVKQTFMIREGILSSTISISITEESHFAVKDV